MCTWHVCHVASHSFVSPGALSPHVLYFHFSLPLLSSHLLPHLRAQKSLDFEYFACSQTTAPHCIAPLHGPDGRFLSRATPAPDPLNNLKMHPPGNAPGSSLGASQPDATNRAQGANPEQPNNNGTSGNATTGRQVNMLLEQLLVQAFLALLSHNALSTTVPGQAPTVAALVGVAAFPQFMFMATQLSQAGTSLLDLFPTIEGSVLLEIASHVFKPGNLSKLDPCYKDCS